MENTDALTEAENQYFESEGEVSPEQAPETEQSQEQEQPEKLVDLRALHEERGRRRELQSEVQELREKLDGFSSFKDEFLQLKEQYQKAQEPNFEDDPLGRTEYELNELKSRLESQEQRLSEQDYYSQQQEEYNNLVSRYQNEARSYAQQNQEFAQAYNHLLNSRIKEYEAMGYSSQEAMGYAQQEEISIAAKAFEDGANPAERIYQLAKLRGFSANQQDLNTVAEGLETSKTLSNANGSPEPKSSLEAMLELDGEEFDKAWAEQFGE